MSSKKSPFLKLILIFSFFFLALNQVGCKRLREDKPYPMVKYDCSAPDEKDLFIRTNDKCTQDLSRNGDWRLSESQIEFCLNQAGQLACKTNLSFFYITHADGNDLKQIFNCDEAKTDEEKKVCRQ